MSMEKMQVLKMLESGRINSEEAARLLQSVGGDSHTSSSYGRSSDSSSDRSYDKSYDRSSDRSYDKGYDRSYARNNSNSERSYTSDTKFEDFVGDLSRKFEVFAKDMEPRLQKLTETVVETTANVADKISKSISESSSVRASSDRGYDKGISGARPPERNFEMVIQPGYNELNLSALNGELVVKGYNGDKLSVKIFAKARRSGGRIELLKLGNKYYLDYEDDDFEKVLVDALVPESMFRNVTFRNLNGIINVSTIAAEYFVAEGSNGNFELKDIRADNINIESSNGRMNLTNLKAQNAKIENLNGPVQAQLIDIANMKLESSNGSVGISVADYNYYNDYMWSVETSNAKLSLNLPSHPSLGYYIKAHTSLNSVKIGLTGLNYLYSDNFTTEARSINYDKSSKHVKLCLETSNAPLNIN